MKAGKSADPSVKKQIRVFEMRGLVLGSSSKTDYDVLGYSQGPQKMLQPGGIELREGFSILPAAAGFFL